MNQTVQLLTEIYRSAELTKHLLSKLTRRGSDSEFRRVMADQYAEYHDIVLESQRQFAGIGRTEVPKRCGSVERAGTSWAIVLHERVARSTEHLAELLTHEAIIRLIGICRAIRENTDANDEAKELAHRLRITDENNLRQLLRYV